MRHYSYGDISCMALRHMLWCGLLLGGMSYGGCQVLRPQQIAIPTPTQAAVDYAYYCADCHGVDMDGGMASSLRDGRWRYGSGDEDIFRSIAVGMDVDGMPGFGTVMSKAEIDALIRLLRAAEREKIQ